MRTIAQSLLIVLTLLGLVAWSIYFGSGLVLAHGIRSDKARVTAPNVAASDLAELVNGNSTFAFDLYHFLRKRKDGNLFYSPYSISLALAMTYAGARGETERQMANTLHFILSQKRLHPAFNSLNLVLASRGKEAQGKDGQGFRLKIANAIWAQQGYPFLSEFLDTLTENYGAGPRAVDFSGNPEAARATINNWVSEQTEGRIQELVPRSVIDTLTRLVLTNAVYFNAAWAEPFDKWMTSDGLFHLLDGSQVTVAMMRKTTSFGYTEGEGYRAVELPYDGRELAMVIFLPETGRFEAFEDSLDAGRAKAIIEDLEYYTVALTMPKFKVESVFRLADALAAMGMPLAFSPDEADFSGMDGVRSLYIGDVLHKAFVSVDEAGTEAAAATAVEMAITAMPDILFEVTVDRPFIFLIRDIETGAILFVGRVMDPTS